ncbi:MAG: hypothetical protein PHH21_01645 [Candidatus Pacebacteria bacterium]|nr:hypothetical protein [Candidatus Paceibacterota bacterium]
MTNIIEKNWLKLVAAILLFWALADNPYSYYQFLRWAILIISGYSAYISYKNGRIEWSWAFVIIAILFNPIIPFYLSRGIWQLLDLITILIFLISSFNNRKD